ncbi:MAG: adenylyltransferase [Deferribacteres bacterium]|nr:adenylyltransferase [Deferribacteres bacterium]
MVENARGYVMQETGIKRIWAPWRMRYIDGTHQDKGCIFCTKPEEDISKDRENLILYRGKKAFIIMNLFPYTNGHVMVTPYKHTGNIEELDNEEILEVMRLTQFVVKAMKSIINPEGFNIGFNIGRPAGAGVVDHIHMHIVPRWVGDTNFMPLLAETKVISEHIFDTYDKLKKALSEQGEL